MTNFRRLGVCKSRVVLTPVTQLCYVDPEPPMDGPGDASDAGEPRLLESSHRAISDGLGGFVVTTDLPALNVVRTTRP